MEGDVLLDIGCGDGRVLCAAAAATAAVRGAQNGQVEGGENGASSAPEGGALPITTLSLLLRCAVGIEYDERFYSRAAERVRGLPPHLRGGEKGDRVRVIHGDAVEILKRLRLGAEDEGEGGGAGASSSSPTNSSTSSLEGIPPITVVFMYLVPTGLALVAPLLEPAVASGRIRVVTNIFSVKGWEEKGLLRERRRVGGKGGGGGALSVYLYGKKE